MKRKNLFFLLLFIPMMAIAQDKVITEVCGVKFGYAYKLVQKSLKKQFGKPYAALSVENKNLLYQNKLVDGVVYDEVDFKFAPHLVMGGRLNEIALTKKFSSAAEVDKWVNGIKAKHSLYQSKDSYEECTIYYGGISPLDDSKYGFKIIVLKMDNFYNIDMTYGPYGY